ncbi:MAG TPA: DUF4142 domain-containing protein [Humisphaera sp.]|nr:DUF4142 domain-containing protein [Humisphaera sp.]
MINRVIAATAALGLALGVASSVSAQSEAQRTTGSGTQERNTPGATGQGQSTAGAGQRDRMSQQRVTQQDEQEFIKAASSGNNFEIQLSQYVQQRSQDQQVKELAQKLAQDHQQAEQQLRQVAQQSGVTLENGLMPAQQAKLQEFQKKQGAELDRAYIFCNVGDHHKDIMEYRWAAQNAQSSQLKQYCEQTLPHLQDHLRQVDQVASSVLGINEAQTASERIMGEHGGQNSTPTTPGSTTPGSSGQGNQGTPGNTGNTGSNGGRTSGTTPGSGR